MKTNLIAAATTVVLAAVPADAQGTLGAAGDKLTTSAIGGMAKGDHATNKLEIERARPARPVELCFGLQK